ncbi:MAG: HDIG domain-containing protein [Chlamydiia bacterium]|nr:HDIG domain-containing protein [Chlamydiia bacterium]
MNEELRHGWREWLSSNHRGWRIIVGFVCFICLALFVHFREVRFEVLELNAIAGRYVVATVDFEFPDYESTFILKQQGAGDIGAIYQIDDRELRDARNDLEEKMIRSKEWREASPYSTFEEMYKAADELETELFEARFTDPRTLQKIRELNLPDSHYFEWKAKGEEIPIVLPETFWKKIAERMAKNDAYHPQTISYVLRSFQQQSWTLVEDTTLEHSLRASVTRAIPEKMTRVQAGTRIIDQGERITQRHIAMMQAMKQTLSDNRQLTHARTIVSSLLLALIFTVISALYFRVSQPSFLRSLQQIALFVCIVILTLLIAKLTEYMLLKSSSVVIQGIRYPIVAPFATILICILLSPRIALFAATFLSIILSVSLAVDHSRFLILNLVTSIVVIICSRAIRKRKQIFAICLKSWFSAIPVLFAYMLSDKQMSSVSFFSDVGASLIFLLATAVLVVGLLPALESLFGVVTDMALMEYMDPSSELLCRLAAEIPGTYQHSLVLANLAEACAQAIGANGLFCRVATLYHDIGKLNNPQFFTENQQSEMNIHQLLTPLESTHAIISHVIDGVMLAHKYHLPDSFIDIIREHHGTTLVYYFYHKQLELRGGKKEEVDERQFRYPGPRPRSRESGIIMICDTVEAASRSLEETNEATLAKTIQRIISDKQEDGQFDNCQLTFEELAIIKKTLVKTLLLAHHIRVKYPKK